MVRSKILSSGIILLLFFTFAEARSIDGLWQVNRSGDLVEIRSTNYGLKAKFINDSSWEHYDEVRRDIFEDRRGNRYYVKNSNRITWESRDGRRVINLEKSNQRRGRARNYDPYDYNYDDRYDSRRGNPRNDRHVCSSACGTSCSIGIVTRNDGVSGRWVNRWRSIVAYVEYDGYNVRMKTNRSARWTTYRRTNSRKLIFEDKWGNRLRFRNNGRLEWRRADGRRDIDFRQDF